MRALIINADDFGLTAGINRAVLEAYQTGVLTSATLMAVGLAWHEAVELARANPGLGVGVHLTLTALRPVLPPEEVPSLVDKRGRFRRLGRAPLWRKDEVEKEWRAQITRLVEAGLKPTHLDSHHHVHLWPGLVDVAVKLAREFELPALRLISPQSFALMGIGGWQRRLAGISWRRAGKLACASPVTVAGLEAFPPDRQGMGRFVARLGPGVHELFCHPGSEDDAELAGISSLTERRARERELLTAGWFKKILAEADIALVNYRYFEEEKRL